MKNIRGYFYAAVAFAVAAFGIWAFTPDKVGYSLSAEVNAGSMQDTFIGTEITYDAAHPEDYFIGQAVQGDGGWYIYGGSVGKGYSVLNPIGEKLGADADYNLWKKDDDGKTWNGIWWRNEFHCNATLGVVAVWKAPSTGSVRFTGKIADVQLGESGVGYEVNVWRRNDDSCELLYGEAFSEGYSVNLSGISMDVDKNDKFLFEMNPLCADEMKCNFFVGAEFVSDGVDMPDSQEEYEKTVAGLDDTQDDNEYYKFYADGAEIPDSELTSFFSDEQGKDNVWFLKGDIEGLYEPMAWKNGVWSGEIYQEISRDLEFSTGSAGNHTMLAWRADSDGRLEAIVREKNMSFSEDVSDSGYDGVRFQIAVRRYDLEKKSFSSPEYLFERDAAAGDYFIKTSRLVLEMNAGDLLFFIVDGKSTNWCDHYSVMPKFDYTSTGETVELPDDIGAEPIYEAQYGSEQGEFGWYYMTGFEDEYYRMIYDAGEFLGIEAYNSVNALHMTPGNGMAAARMFACTDSGVIDVKGYVQKLDHGAAEYGDGINLKYYIKGQEPFIERKIEGNDYTQYDLSRRIEVNRGDVLVIWVDSGDGNYNAYDTVICKVFVTYIESENDGDGSIDLGDRGIIDGYPVRPQYIGTAEAEAYYGKAQGENGWYFGYGSVENGYYLMDYDVYEDVWKNPEVDTFTRITKGSLHPGYDGEEALLIKRIDRKGSIRLMAYYNLHTIDGDGIVASVWYNGEKLSEDILSGTERKYFYRDIEVEPGDIFILSIGNEVGHDNSFDNTSATMVVHYFEEGEPTTFPDDDVGQLEKVAKKPDDKLTELDIPSTGGSGGCGSFVGIGTAVCAASAVIYLICTNRRWKS